MPPCSAVIPTVLAFGGRGGLCEWRPPFVNLSLTLWSIFLLLKDLRRSRLDGRLTSAPARLNPW